MGESLTQQRRVEDEIFSECKLLSRGTRQVTVPLEEAPANSVPAAAVVRGGQALFGITGRKGRAGGKGSHG